MWSEDKMDAPFCKIFSFHILIWKNLFCISGQVEDRKSEWLPDTLPRTLLVVMATSRETAGRYRWWRKLPSCKMEALWGLVNPGNTWISRQVSSGNKEHDFCGHESRIQELEGGWLSFCLERTFWQAVRWLRKAGPCPVCPQHRKRSAGINFGCSQIKTSELYRNGTTRSNKLTWIFV